jgi:predicted acylesterase/phospholipase RssA
MKRAIALAGGGPAVGISIGSLKRLDKEKDITFDVWSTACIGAWLAVVYNQCDKGKEIEQTEAFFRKIFVEDAVYSKFPIATAFAPNMGEYLNRMLAFVTTPESYENLIVPQAIQESAENVWAFACDPTQWNMANFNNLMLNDILRANPFARFMTSMMWKGSPNGIAQVYYPDSALLNSIRFDRLYEKSKPVIHHNAYNITDQRLELFGNKDQYSKITAQTLCACSALPFIETTVEMDGKTYCEGATIDTVNFEHLMTNFPDLDEVWVSRILDHKQIRKPENLYDALNNLIMLFAATTSEDDVKLFKYKIKEHGYKVKVVEIHVPAQINYDWSYSNLDHSIDLGYKATDTAIKKYRGLTKKPLLKTVS